MTTLENVARLNFLIEKAASIVGSEYKLAKKMEIPQQNISSWKSGAKTCPPAARAVLAGIAGEDAVQELISATLEREEGTKRGALLGELLGQRAGRVIEESQAAAVAGLSPSHAALEAVLQVLDESPKEQEAKAAIMAILEAFPGPTPGAHEGVKAKEKTRLRKTLRT